MTDDSHQRWESAIIRIYEESEEAGKRTNECDKENVNFREEAKRKRLQE